MQLNENYKFIIGENIRLWREFKLIKQSTLANEIGKSTSILFKIENSKEAPNTVLLKEISNKLGIKFEQLFTKPN